MRAIEFPLESERLLVRPFEVTDVADAHAVYGDPDVMRHVAYGTANHTLAASEEMIAGYMAHQVQHGFAFWALMEKSSGALIGDVGFEVDTGSEVEFGYTLGRKWWGKGYATEASLLCVRTAVDVIGLRSLKAVVDPANPASAHVLEKVGFVADGSTDAYGREHLIYRIDLRNH